MQLRELDQSLWRDLEAFVEEECESQLPLVPRRFEVSFGSERAAPELQRGLELGVGPDALREDRPDRRRSVRRARDRPGLQVRQARALGGGRSRASCASRSLSTCSSCAISSGSSRSAASTGRSRATRRARGLVRADEAETLPGYVKQRLPRRGGVLGRRRVGTGDGDGACRADPGGRRPPRPARRRLPELVRPLDRSAGSSGRERTALNEQQLAAVEAAGEVFVSAGAGTGKTAVLVERVVRAVCDRGLDVDSILVITYTRRAAGELRTRIRAALAERGRHDLARELDGAWISTIHGFCARLLRAYPLAAGPRPAFPRARRVAGGGAPLGGVRRGARGVLRRRRPAASRAARDVRERPAAADADERLRDAARRRP